MLMIQILAIVVPLLATFIFALVGYAVKQTLGRFTDKLVYVESKINSHIDGCSEIDKNVLDAGIKNVQVEIGHLRDVVHWLGNCVMHIAGKFNVRLPDRPLLVDAAGADSRGRGNHA